MKVHIEEVEVKDFFNKLKEMTPQICIYQGIRNPQEIPLGKYLIEISRHTTTSEVRNNRNVHSTHLIHICTYHNNYHTIVDSHCGQSIRLLPHP